MTEPYRPSHHIVPRASEMTRKPKWPILGEPLGLDHAVRVLLVKQMKRYADYNEQIERRLAFGAHEPTADELAAWQAKREVDMARIRREREAEEAHVERMVADYPRRLAEATGLHRAVIDAHPPALTGAYRHCGGCPTDEYGHEPAWPCFHYSLTMEHQA